MALPQQGPCLLACLNLCGAHDHGEFESARRAADFAGASSSHLRLDITCCPNAITVTAANNELELRHLLLHRMEAKRHARLETARPDSVIRIDSLPKTMPCWLEMASSTLSPSGKPILLCRQSDGGFALSDPLLGSTVFVRPYVRFSEDCIACPISDEFMWIVGTAGGHSQDPEPLLWPMHWVKVHFGTGKIHSAETKYHCNQQAIIHWYIPQSGRTWALINHLTLVVLDSKTLQETSTTPLFTFHSDLPAKQQPYLEAVRWCRDGGLIALQLRCSECPMHGNAKFGVEILILDATAGQRLQCLRLSCLKCSIQWSTCAHQLLAFGNVAYAAYVCSISPGWANALASLFVGTFSAGLAPCMRFH